MMRRVRPYALGLCIGLATSGRALAADPAADGAQPNAAVAEPANEPAQDDIWSRKTLLGDAGGVRPYLEKYGLSLGATETSEVLANLTGGIRSGPIYEGLTDLTLNFDLRPNYQIRGNFFAHAYQIHGRGLTASHLDNLNVASGIEAAATTRLVELYYEQHYSTWLRVRIGQQTITTEFLNPESARVFVNGAFGWPTLPSVDLPSGGPGFPLGTPAVRARIDPMEGLSWFTAVFNGDPTGGGVGASQLRDPSGTAFRVGDGAFVITELRYNPESSNHNGTYRFGAWYNTQRFRDLRFDTNGLSLADPASNGRARLHDGDYSLFATIDEPFLDESDSGFVVFARAMGAPGDRNLVNLYTDFGVDYRGPFGRKDDVAGIAVGYAQIAGRARGFDRDVATFGGGFAPVRSGETVIEATYRAQVTPWWQLQPDFQYVINPGGGIANPLVPTRRIGNATIAGVRTAVTF